MVIRRSAALAAYDSRGVRVVFVPQSAPATVDAAQYRRWQDEQWQRLGNYIIALEDEIASLSARLTAGGL
jgi:hypothetical protein